MTTSHQPKGDGHSEAPPSPPELPPGPGPANGHAPRTAEGDRTQSLPPSPAPDLSAALAPEPDELFLNVGPEPTDDSPTVISQAHPRPVTSDEVFSGALRGRKLAHFELLEPIGVGGMAAVIRARDTELDRFVALKILPPEMATDPESVRRFHQEARAAARLDHENVARVFFCGEDQGLHFIAFEFVEGSNLRTVIERRGRLPVTDALHYMLQIATGLEHAASRGVVHRDIKPSNLIISSNGRAKLVDMGLARSQEPQSDQGLTQSGVTLGTFDYISPEQALEPREADVRSDIYSLGCTFYHALTGQPPVPEGTAAKKLHHHQHIAPIDPRQLEPDIPDEVAAILARMMAKDPKARYQSVDKLVQHLIVVAQKLGVNAEVPKGLLFVDTPLPDPPRARPLLLAAAGAVVLVGLVLVLGQLGSSLPKPDDPRPPAPPGPAVKDGRPVARDTSPRPRTPEQPLTKDGEPSPRPAAVARFSKPKAKASELARFLNENQGANALEITLAGDLDLGGVGDGEDEPVPALLFKARKVSIQAQNPAERPTIRLTYDLRKPDRPIWAALNFEGCDEVTLKGVRIVVNATGAQVAMAGIRFRGGQRCTVEDCEFVQVAPPLQPEADRLTSVVVDALFGARARLDLKECYFVGVQDLPTMEGIEKGGHDAVLATGPVQVEATNCAFAPHAVLFHLTGGSKEMGTALTLRNCSALAAGDWAAFRLDNEAGCLLTVKNSLFSRPDNTEADAGTPEDRRTSVLIQQTGARAGALGYAGTQNRYHNLTAFWIRPALEEEEAEINTWRAFREEIEKTSSSGDEKSLVLEQSPWQESDPLALLKQQKPQQAFLVNPKLRELRQSTDPRNLLSQRVLGVERGIWGEFKVPPLSDRPPDPVAGAKELVVDPSVAVVGGGVYRSLNQALEEIKQRGVIRIRHTGLLPIEPVRLEKAGLEITIQPDQDHHPVLTLGATTEQDAFLFRVHDGKLTLKDLEFHLTPRRADFKAQSVVEVIGEGSCTFKECVVTLDRAGRDVPLAVVRLADPAQVMKMDPPGPTAAQGPGLTFEDCFVRGDGELLRVRGSRPFVLEARNCLFVLAGSCLNIHGNREDVPAGQVSVVRLERVTAYLADASGASSHLVRLQAGKDVKGLGLLHVRAFDNLFVSRDGSALVHLEGPETSDEKLRGLFLWDGSKHNAYGNFTHLFDQQPPGEDSRRRYDPENWKDYTGERDGLFAPRVKFTDPPAADAELTRLRRTNFRVRDTEQQSYGVNLDKLPTPAGLPAAGPEQ